MVLIIRYFLIGAMFILVASSCFRNREEDTRLTLTGYFRDDKLRGFTYYVENPTRKAIQSLCVEKKIKLVDQKKTKRALIIAFFGDKENTPNVTISWTYDWPKSADSHLVAKCGYNPFNSESRLHFFKRIPE